MIDRAALALPVGILANFAFNRLIASSRNAHLLIGQSSFAPLGVSPISPTTHTNWQSAITDLADRGI